jgi:triosephosphate isomerase
MKRKLVVGNWKMHLDIHGASILLHRLDKTIKPHRDIEIVLAPSLLAIQPLSQEVDKRKFSLAAQNAFYKDEGAYTGEVSFTMLRGLVQYAIIGHSERRLYFNESLEMVRDKVQAAIRNDISPILCIGETKQERAANETRRVIHDQLTTALANITAEEVSRVVVAYEPVWAIGTGDPEKPDDVRDIMAWIRHILEELYGAQAAVEKRLIYGASVEPDFVGGLMAIEDVDGFLVGGDSLNYQKFAAIVEGVEHSLRQRESGDG